MPNTALKRKTYTVKRLLTLIWPAILAALGIAAAAVSRISPDATERYYSRGIFPVISNAIGTVSSLVDFSLAAVFFVILFSGLLFIIAFSIRHGLKHGARYGILLFLRTLACAACVVLFLFCITCAPNYNRLSFSEQSGMSPGESATEDLKSLCEELMSYTNYYRSLASEEDGVFSLKFHAAAFTALEAFNSLSSQYGFIPTVRSQPKPMLCSEIMSYLNITGFYFPYTAEANINAHMPSMELPFTMCHELSHTAGFMREDEANFISFLACRMSDDNDFRYSGYLCALINSMNMLARYDYEAYLSVADGYSDGVLSDLYVLNEYWAQYDTPVAQASTSINNAYLKANNQSDGTHSYGRMVDLLLADYKERHSS